jgi:anti-sigma factor RsiW
MTVNNEAKLDRLFQAYRETTAYNGANPNFMPELWARIESRRANSRMVERFSKIFATATVAAAFALGIFVSVTPQQVADETWVETIANHHFAQQDLGPVQVTVPVENASFTNSAPSK